MHRVIVVLAAIGSVVASDPARACTCLVDQTDFSALYAKASLGFSGTIIDVEDYELADYENAPCLRDWPHHLIVVEVDQVWLGVVPERISLLSILGDGSNCGIQPGIGEHRPFFTVDDEQSGLPRVDICTMPRVAIENIVVASYPPVPGVDERAEVCRRRPRQTAPDSCATGIGSPAPIAFALLIPVCVRRRRRLGRRRATPEGLL